MESGVDRKELYVVTKVNKADDDLEASFEKSLKKLQLEYVDLLVCPNAMSRESSMTERTLDI